MTDELKKFAITLARPKLCEIQLSIFLIACSDCQTEEQVIEIFKKKYIVNK